MRTPEAWCTLFDMDEARLIKDYIDVLIYPAVILLVVGIFRRPLERLIDRVQSGKGFGVEFETASPPQSRDAVPDTVPPTNPAPNGGVAVDVASREQMERRSPVEILSRPRDAEVSREALEAALNFERIYRSIYGSQIALLKFLARAEVRAHGAVRSTLENFYTYAKSNGAKTTASGREYGWDDYIGFLANNRLVSYDPSQERAQITPRGMTFLHYLVQAGLPEAKPL